MTDILTVIFSVTTLSAIIAKVAPLLLASIGGAFTQQGGILNIGLEGMMLIGAFTAVVVGHYANNAYLGVLAAIGASVLLALLYAFVSLNLGADFTVVGIGINLLAGGATVLMLTVFFGNPGVTPPEVKTVLPAINLGPLGKIPVIGVAFNNQTLLVWLAILLVPVYSWMLYRTKFGVHLRAVGEDVEAARAAGISPFAVKYQSILISGVLCGLAGSQLAMAALGSFTQNMTAGRGFIAVAALTFGLAKPVRTLVACLIFGAADAIGDRLGIAGANSAVSLMMPYIITLVALVIAAGRARPLILARSRRALATNA